MIIQERYQQDGSIVVSGIPVNRALTPQQVIDATGRAQYTDRKVVDAMPRGTGEEAEVFFFKPGRHVSDDDLEEEYKLRNLVPAFPDDLATVNEADPTFADQHPNGTHWKDANGKWCYIAFRRWNDVRAVHVSRDAYDWVGHCWFAGVPVRK